MCNENFLSAEGWALKGDALFDIGQYEDSLEAYNRAIKLDPNDAQLWNSKGAALSRFGRHTETLAAYDRAIQLDPSQSLPWYNRGSVLNKLHRPEESLRAFDRAIELDPKRALPWNGRGYALIDLCRPEESLMAFDRAIELDPRNARFWNGRGNALVDLFRPEEALLEYDRSVVLDPKDPEQWNGRGNALVQLGRYKEAFLAYDRSIKFEPTDAMPWNGRGNVLAKLDRHEEALKAFDRSIELDPKDARIWYNRGMALVGIGQPEEALKAYIAEAVRCFRRSGHLLLIFPKPVFGMLIWELLRRFHNEAQVLLSRRLLLSRSQNIATTSFAEMFRHTMEDCRTPLAMLDFFDADQGINVIERSLWKGIVHYYYGDAPEAKSHLEVVDSEDEDNLMGQYYLLQSLKAYFEPCEKEEAFAIEKASNLLKGLGHKTVEQYYYAGQLFLEAGKNEKALQCFSHGESHLPSLYMKWHCLQNVNDPKAIETLGEILEGENELVCHGRCGYLLPQTPPLIDPSNPDWLRDMWFYVHFREVENVTMEIARRNDLDQFPAYNRLFPDVKRRLQGERDAYFDRAKTFQIAAKAMQTLDDMRQTHNRKMAEELRVRLLPWLGIPGLRQVLNDDPGEAVTSAGDVIANTDLRRTEIPFTDVILCQFLDGRIQTEDAVYLLFYHRLKQRYDGVDRASEERMIRGMTLAGTLAPLVGCLTECIGRQWEGASVFTALGLVPLLINYSLEASQKAMQSKPFPTLSEFRDGFYEWQAKFGDRKTLEDGGKGFDQKG